MPSKLLFAAATLTVPAACLVGLTAHYQWPDSPAVLVLVVLAVLWVAAIATACTMVIVRFIADCFEQLADRPPDRGSYAALAEMERRISREE
jgi:hypothetical protein